ncbi:MFS transporter [Propionispora vibrioides]|uniref:Predicted arabinose efflux permease, MFS family n=1 Tax=Propionispora vibrioides TaxID=112903 RepID=A0A1H8XEV8_9FIRM|nr:MFS transporter [Propionispora vibrioides]SEP38352.1 Predicted arabinose efflux permease, MFS family [Propionispora vibrioides]
MLSLPVFAINEGIENFLKAEGEKLDEFSLLSRNFVLLCLSGFLYFGSFYLLLPTIPQFVAGLGGTASQIGLVMGAFTLASVIFRPYFGKQADRYGRKRLMLLGAGCFAALFVLYGVTREILPLYGLRLLHGVAHGCYLAAAYAYIADLAPPKRRGEVIGVYGVANVIAMALFPAWGSLVIASSHDFSRLFTYSLIIAGLACTAVMFVDELKPEGTQVQKVSLKQVAKQPAVLVASFTFLTASTVYGTVITFLPVYAPQQGIANFGIFFTTYACFTLVSRVVAGKLSDRYGRKAVILPFLVLLALATGLLPFLSSERLLIVIGGCFGLGFGAFMPALNAFVVDRTLPHERASALAFFTAFMDIGITTGAVGLGIVGEHWGYGTMYGLGSLLVCLGMLLFALGSEKTRLPDAGE